MNTPATPIDPWLEAERALALLRQLADNRARQTPLAAHLEQLRLQLRSPR